MALEHQPEVERKYDVDDATVMPSLVGVASVAAVVPAVTLDLEAVYFDTEDLVLARSGVTLRRRTGGQDDGWHLKLPVGEDTRTEVTLPLGRAVRTVPQRLLAPVRALVRDQPVVPVARLSTHRLVYELLDERSHVLAEVCDDSVTVERLVPGGESPSWREWEVELRAGGSLSLDAVEAALVAAGAVRSGTRSKLVRALGDDAVSQPRGAADDGSPRAITSARDLLVARLVEHRHRLHTHDAGVRTGQEEGVHRLRIAARRLRSALTTFKPILEEGAGEELRAELRWLGQALSPARDSQVLRERLDALAAEQPPELVMGPVTRRIDVELTTAYQAGTKEAVAQLESERYYRLLDALDAFIEAPPVVPRALRKARKVAPKLLRRDAARLRTAAEAALGAEGPERDPALHEARKKAKRMRYAAEAVEPVLGGSARTLAKRAKKVQEALGLHQDSVVAREVLREYAVQAHLGGDNAFTFGLLYGAERQKAAEAEEAFAAAWKKFPLR